MSRPHPFRLKVGHSLSAALFLLQAAGGALAAFGGGTSSTTTRTRTTPLAMSADGVAVVGCGVLGTSLCRQILGSSDFGSRSGEWRGYMHWDGGVRGSLTVFERPPQTNIASLTPDDNAHY